MLLKHIESYKPRERYQADIVLIPNYVWDVLKYIFAVMSHFTKYECVIPLNYNKAETILTAKKCFITHNISNWYQTDKLRVFNKQYFWKFVNRKELLESRSTLQPSST